MNEPTSPPADVTAALKVARQAANDAVAASAAAGQGGGALVPAGADVAMNVKTQMAASRAMVATARRTALEAQAKAKELIEQQKRALDAQVRAMAAELEPLQQQMKMLEEGIWTMNLYLGRDEELHVLAEGEPAPAGAPIHVRQQVLAMDEESALYAESGGMDVRNIEDFDRWITADPAHLHQVLPEDRGVVAIIPRRQGRDYKDPWLQDAMDQANAQSWWLIRNGANVYRMLTNFQVGKRLVPARNEFTAMFVDRWTKQPLEPGSKAWLEAEKVAGARERHYMRIALILQGLVDRTAVFQPLPVAGLSLLAPEHYDAGHVVLVADDENQITSGRKPFYQWLAEKNLNLTPGMRVIITTRHQDWPETSRDRWSYDQHPRLSPARAEYPSTGEVHTITRHGNEPGSLVFTYARTREEWLRDEWGREEYRVPKTKASCVIFPSDQFVLPVDLVTVDEMKDYLGARTQRHAYADMFPVLNAAIAFKEAEAAAEAPFRDLLAAQIAQADDITVSEAAGLLDELVTWWKIGNRWHRPLNGDAPAEAKAARMILAEHAARRRTADTSDAAAGTLAHLRAKHPDALFVARKKDGSWVVGTPSPRKWARPTDKERNEWGDQVAPLDVFVDLAEYTKTGKARSVKTWQVPAPATVNRWTMLHTSDRWETWNRRARRAEHLSDPEIDEAIGQIRALPAPDGHRLVAVMYDEATSRYDKTAFEAWYQPTTPPPFDPQHALTGEFEYVTSRTRRVTWTRQGGRVVLAAGRASESNVTTWKPRHNWGLDPHRVGEVPPPWAEDRRGNQVVFLDDAVLADAQQHADLWDANRRARAVLEGQARTLTDGLAQAWVDRATGEAKARFLEDYLDESLWEDHAKGLRIHAPWLTTRVNGYTDVDAGLARVTNRLVESGRAPYGLTVAEAIELLGEPVVTTSRWSEDREVTFPDDVLDLRYPGAPAGG